MEIEKLAKKLKPLMPDKVDQWLRARDSGDPKLKSLIDQEILYHAHKKLGDFRNKILLSLPNKSLMKGEIHLGQVLYETDKWPASISHSELLQHLAIFGRSGSGKTNLAFHILKQIAENNVPFLFLDFKRTARHLTPNLKNKIQIYTPGRSISPLAFNPFIVPPGLEYDVYVNHVVDAMAESFTLGDGSKSLLQTAISTCYSKNKGSTTVSEILKTLKAMPDSGRIKGWKISATRALESIAFGGIGTTNCQWAL